MTETTRSAAKARIALFVAFGLLILFFAGYSVAWNRAAATVKSEIARFAEREAAAGRSFEYTGVKTSGYPFFLNGVVEGVVWSNPGVGAFEAERVTIAAVPFDPTRIIFAPRGEQVLTLGGEPYDLRSDDLRFNLEPGFVAVEGHGVTLTGEERTVTLGDLIANNQRLSDGSSIAVSVKRLGFGGDHPVTVPFFDMAASKQTGRLTIAAMTMGIGSEDDTAPTQLTGEGDLRLGDDGLASGTVSVSFRNEGPLIDIIARSSGFDEDAAETAKAMLGMMSEQGTKQVTLPLVIEEGDIRLGVIPLGTLPPIRP